MQYRAGSVIKKMIAATALLPYPQQDDAKTDVQFYQTFWPCVASDAIG